MKSKLFIPKIVRNSVKLASLWLVGTTDEFYSEILKFTGKKSKLSVVELTYRRFLNWIGAGLIAVSLIILQGLISLSRLDTPQFISVLSFSLSIPLLIGSLTIINFELTYKLYAPRISRFGSDKATKLPSLIEVVYLVGMLLVAVGVGSAFWHLSWLAAVLFGTVMLVMAIFIIGYIWDMEELKIEDEEEQWD